MLHNPLMGCVLRINEGNGILMEENRYGKQSGIPHKIGREPAQHSADAIAGSVKTKPPWHFSSILPTVMLPPEDRIQSSTLRQALFRLPEDQLGLRKRLASRGDGGIASYQGRQIHRETTTRRHENSRMMLSGEQEDNQIGRAHV